MSAQPEPPHGVAGILDELKEACRDYSGSGAAELFQLAYTRLVEAMDYADNLERGLAYEKTVGAQYERALNAALDKGNELTERVVALQAQLAAANDRANNAEQASLNWRHLYVEANSILELYKQSKST